METEQIKKSCIKNLHYCIWDIGKVIYDYSLNPLNTLMSTLTASPEAFNAQEGVYKFDYDNYMKGLVSFEDLCGQLCAYCGVENQSPQKLNQQIATAFHAGIGRRFAATLQMMRFMKEHGVKNCILSNALPILSNTLNLDDLVEKKHIFTSYELGMLKPETQIFKTVISKLNAAPSSLVFIDDKQKNVNGALSCGIYAVVYNEQTIINELMQLF